MEWYKMIKPKGVKILSARGASTVMVVEKIPKILRKVVVEPYMSGMLFNGKELHGYYRYMY